MSNQFEKVAANRLSSMIALAESVNLYLKVEGAALSGNEELSSAIKSIIEKLPECYNHADDTKEFHTFYICQSLITLISEFEGFLVDIMKLILKEHPKKLGNVMFNLSEIIEIGDIDTITGIAAERFLNSIMYKKANEYRISLTKIISANEEFLAEEWITYVELKARRDIGIHNGWIINDVYLRKTGEVGLNVEKDGFFPFSNKDFWGALQLFNKSMSKIEKHCAIKFGKVET